MFLSIITPTYNRGYILECCYKSLVAQSNYDFEWIIVDDGSTDNTEIIVNAFKAEEKITIKYIKQQNGGKHRAHNTGVMHAIGELCVCLDSDDLLTEDAVAIIYKTWRERKTSNSIGILAKRGSMKTGEPICCSWPEYLSESKMISLLEEYSFAGDTALFFDTSLMKNNLFMEFEKEKFLPETNLYFDLDRLGTMILLDKVVYLCEYLPDGLTAKFHNLLISNPLGTANTYYKQMLLSKYFKSKLKYAVLTNIYLRACVNKKMARIDEKNFLIMITKIPAGMIGKKFLRKFKNQ